jgi:phosphoribulokinase/uridine kinase
MFVTAKGKTIEVEKGIRFQDIVPYFQSEEEYPLLLAKVGSRIYELHKKLPEEDITIEWITIRDSIGMQSYQRSAIFMLLKAFYHHCKGIKDFNVSIDYTLGGGFYGHLSGDVRLTADLLSKVKATMEGYAKEAMPIMKRNVSTGEARELFRHLGMPSKEELFRFRMTSRVNIYSLGNFQDYFYGAMLLNTSYVTLFDLFPYGDGFILLLPREENPGVLPEFKPMDKLYRVQKTSAEWAAAVGIKNIGALNQKIVSGDPNSLILMQEAYFEKQIGNMAMEIVKKNKRMVLIAGPSSSGKTSFSKRLSIQLAALGKQPHAISVDNYFRGRDFAPRDAEGNVDFESIENVDLPQFNEDMQNLLSGKRVELPRYNFFTGKREYKGDFLELGEEDILVIEGIHCLNDRMSASLPEDSKYRIYISALTPLNIDEHNRIPTTDVRLLRRMVRDNRTRGYSAENTISMWKSVRRGEDQNIFPYQERADVMVNSALIYELPVLKIFAEPLLFQIAEDSPCYQEAKRLLKFLDYVLALSPESIPQNSILREFIGGSCLHVG